MWGQRGVIALCLLPTQTGDTLLWICSSGVVLVESCMIAGVWGQLPWQLPRANWGHLTELTDSCCIALVLHPTQRAEGCHRCWDTCVAHLPHFCFSHLHSRVSASLSPSLWSIFFHPSILFPLPLFISPPPIFKWTNTFLVRASEAASLTVCYLYNAAAKPLGNLASLSNVTEINWVFSPLDEGRERRGEERALHWEKYRCWVKELHTEKKRKTAIHLISCPKLWKQQQAEAFVCVCVCFRLCLNLLYFCRLDSICSPGLTTGTEKERKVERESVKRGEGFKSHRTWRCREQRRRGGGSSWSSEAKVFFFCKWCHHLTPSFLFKFSILEPKTGNPSNLVNQYLRLTCSFFFLSQSNCLTNLEFKCHFGWRLL